MDKIKRGKYRHFKGKEYEVLGIVRHSETLEELVLYKALYKTKDYGENALWVRPVRMFIEKVDTNGKKVPRFALID